MKYSLILTAAATLLFSTVVSAQNTTQRQNPEYVKYLKEDIRRARGNYYPYQFQDIKDVPAPKGFKPFYISHYGRHGSRSSWGGSYMEDLPRELQTAKERGLLTPAGDSLLVTILEMNKEYNGNKGRLTRLGAREHQQLADRMYDRFKPVFTNYSRNVNSVSSTVQRCIVSMAAFTSELARKDPKLNQTWDTGESFMLYLNNESDKPIYSRVNKLQKEMEAEWLPDSLSTMRKIFTDPDAARPIINRNLERFQHDIYEYAILQGSFEVDLNIWSYIPFEAAYRYGESNDVRLYLGQCNSVEYGDRRMNFCNPLVQDVIDKAEHAIKYGDVCADLRFGHDVALLALYSFIGVEGVSARLTAEQARGVWWTAKYCPFAGNLQMVFYRNKAGVVIMKFLQDEKEVRVPELQPYAGDYYYKWDDVREMLEKKIQHWAVPAYVGD